MLYGAVHLIGGHGRICCVALGLIRNQIEIHVII